MKVIILRGISGSGKSTWAKNNAPSAVVVSADHYFIDPDGTYRFDGSKLHEAHQECYRAFTQALEQGVPLIVVDNTNLSAWEISPYILPAQIMGYDVEILTLLCDPEVAIQRKNWVPPAQVRETAKRLDLEARSFPPFMKKMHRTVQNCP